MNNLPEVIFQTLYRILKVSAQNITGVAHRYGKLLHTEQLLPELSLGAKAET